MCLGPWFHRLFARAYLYWAVKHFDLISVAGPGIRAAVTKTDRRIHIALLQGTTAFQTTIHGLQCAGRAFAAWLVAMNNKHITATRDGNAEILFHLRQIAIELAAQVDKEPVVGKFQRCFSFGLVR